MQVLIKCWCTKVLLRTNLTRTYAVLNIHMQTNICTCSLRTNAQSCTCKSEVAYMCTVCNICLNSEFFLRFLKEINIIITNDIVMTTCFIIVSDEQ